MSALATSRKLVAVVSTCVALAGLVRTAAAETAAQEQTAADEWINIPAGIADAANKTAYVTNSSDCLEALDLTNGHTLWENKQVQRACTDRPAISGGRTARHSTAGQYHGPGHPGCWKRPRPYQFAADSSSGMDCGRRGHRSGVHLVRDDGWKHVKPLLARLAAIGGAAPSAAAIAAAKKDETGVARVDLESGRVEVHEEPIPKQTRANKGHFTDVGDIRLIVSERQEKVTGGVQLSAASWRPATSALAGRYGVMKSPAT